MYLSCNSLHFSYLGTTQFSTAQSTDMPTEMTTCEGLNTCEGHTLCNGIDCADGWTGDNCTTPDVFRRSDCPNDIACRFGGTCFDGSCCCVSGYEGLLCETEIDECESNPCSNGGTCIDEIDEYRCACLDGKNIVMLLREIPVTVLYSINHNLTSTFV